uniref:BolA-like protein 2 n=1 Tax=Strigamia maritima TaxID=126957 RepID=T1JBX2_STRMM
MAYTDKYVRDKLLAGLNADLVEVEDISDGCGMKFNVLIVSKEFEGKPLLQRHRLVNSVLGEEMKTIHALSQKTLTPVQWEEQKEKNAK